MLFQQALIEILASEPLWTSIGDREVATEASGEAEADVSSDDDDSIESLNDFLRAISANRRSDESFLSYFIAVVEFISDLLEASRGHQSLASSMLENVLGRKIFADLKACPEFNSKARRE